jgi:hypothetical protein
MLRIPWVLGSVPGLEDGEPKIDFTWVSLVHPSNFGPRISFSPSLLYSFFIAMLPLEACMTENIFIETVIQHTVLVYIKIHRLHVSAKVPSSGCSDVYQHKK